MHAHAAGLATRELNIKHIHINVFIGAEDSAPPTGVKSTERSTGARSGHHAGLPVHSHPPRITDPTGPTWPSPVAPALTQRHHPAGDNVTGCYI